MLILPSAIALPGAIGGHIGVARGAYLYTVTFSVGPTGERSKANIWSDVAGCVLCFAYYFPTEKPAKYGRRVGPVIEEGPFKWAPITI